MIKISAKTDYACRAVLELSLHWPSHLPLQMNEIAQNQQIPLNFLTQILLNLKQIGLVRSVRGKKGGYLLALAPQKIRLSDVVQNMGGMEPASSEGRNSGEGLGVLDSVWSEIDEKIGRAMEDITFETILNRQRDREKALAFQI